MFDCAEVPKFRVQCQL